MNLLSTVTQRVLTSLTTLPTGVHGWTQVAGITTATTILAGISATATGFVDPIQDYDPPSTLWKPASALIVPSLLEEMIWRAAWIPNPVIMTNKTILMTTLLPSATVALVLHVLSHPLAAYTVWPRGRDIFDDPRFLGLATIVLGGATASYIISGGSVWAAAITHGIPVALWRDFFGGEYRLAHRVDDTIGEDKKKDPYMPLTENTKKKS